MQDQYERESPLYTTLETPSPAQPSYSLGPPYTNSFSQAPYYNYRHYTSDILSSASSYGFHRSDSLQQPYSYDGLSMRCELLVRRDLTLLPAGHTSHPPSLYEASGGTSKNYGGIYVPSAASAALPSKLTSGPFYTNKTGQACRCERTSHIENN